LHPPTYPVTVAVSDSRFNNHSVFAAPFTIEFSVLVNRYCFLLCHMSVTRLTRPFRILLKIPVNEGLYRMYISWNILRSSRKIAGEMWEMTVWEKGMCLQAPHVCFNYKLLVNIRKLFLIYFSVSLYYI
jgi:hypothetical protein